MKEQPLKIYRKVDFDFAYENNARNVAFALSLSGYFVRIRNRRSDEWSVEVYTFKKPGISKRSE